MHQYYIAWLNLPNTILNNFNKDFQKRPLFRLCTLAVHPYICMSVRPLSKSFLVDHPLLLGELVIYISAL